MQQRRTLWVALTVAMFGCQCKPSHSPPAASDAGAISPAATRADPPKATATLDDVQVEPKTGLEYVRIPGGKFHYGCDKGKCTGNQRPGGTGPMKSFWLMRTDVTVEAYSKCVKAGVCSDELAVTWQPDVKPEIRSKWDAFCNYGVEGRERHPINCVNAAQAEAFCQWVGGRLPTWKEWEYEATGAERRLYPWGDEPLSADRLNTCDRKCIEVFPNRSPLTEDDGWIGTSPVGSFSKGASKHGLLDMAGNVLQWTESECESLGVDDTSPCRDVRGGSWDVLVASALFSNTEGFLDPASKSISVGFRCAK